MQKFTRSLLMAGSVFGLAACGDDISITEPTPPPAAVVTSVTVAPAQITIAIGERTIMTAQVAVSSGTGTPNTTVAWSSANAAIATVNATSGEVTGVAAGSTTIRATAGGITGAAGVTVRTAAVAVPATVSISSITAGGLGFPVPLNNVQGQIDVTLNVEPGDQRISKVAVLVDGVEVASQTFTGTTSVEQDLASAAFPITLSFNTAQFDALTGATAFKNGPHVISARIDVAGGTQSASSGIPVVFNNTSGFVLLPTSTAGPATDPNGFAWWGGDVTLKFLPVIYSDNTVTSATVTAMGRTATINAANNYSVTFPNTAFNASTNPRGIAGYQTETGAEAITVNSVLSNGQQGPANLLNTGTTPVAGNPTVPLVPALRIDNKAPVVTSVGITPTWMNATYALNATNLQHVVRDTSNVLNNVTGVTGVSGIVYEYWVGATLPGTATSCDLTGLTKVTTGGELAETIVSTAYRIRARAVDKLGNATCFNVEAGDPFGVDVTPPTVVSLTGPADLSAATAPGAYAVTVSDNASGFAAEPVTISMTRLGATAGTSGCIVGQSATTCADTDTTRTLNFAATNGSAVEGYYTTTASVSDQAGNKVALFTRTYLVDGTAPTFSGAVAAPPLITGGAANSFQANVADNLDLKAIFGAVDYPVGATIIYPSQSIGSFGAPLEQTLAASYTINSFIRCLNAANAFALNAGNRASNITLTVSDQANNMATSGLGITANVQACGNVGNMTDVNNAYSAPNTFGPTTAAYGTGFTSVWNGLGTQPGTASSAVTLRAVADVPLNTSGDPFTSVLFLYESAPGEWTPIGTGAGTLAQTQTNRTWTYTFSWTPNSSFAAGNYNIVAVGVDAQGDAVLTAPVVVAVTGS